MGENPLTSEPNLNHARHAMEQLDFIVCQDIFLTTTGKLADVILPSTSFAEKDGTFTNSDRRVQRVRAPSRQWGKASPTGRSCATLPDGWRAPLGRRRAPAGRMSTFPDLGGDAAPHAGLRRHHL